MKMIYRLHENIPYKQTDIESLNIRGDKLGDTLRIMPNMAILVRFDYIFCFNITVTTYSVRSLQKY